MRVLVLGLLVLLEGSFCASADEVNYFLYVTDSIPRVTRITFWGEPYPFGYRYHKPPEECLERRQIETIFGTRTVTVWVCDGNVIERY